VSIRPGLVAAALIAVMANAAAAQDPPPPCSPAVLVTPAFGFADNPEAGSGDAHLYASHAVSIAAGFPLDAQVYTSDAVWTLPTGLMRVSDDLAVQALPDSTPDQTGVVVIAAAAGGYPVTLTWTQTDGTHNGRCTGSASTTLRVVAPARPRLRRPRVTPGLPDEATVVLAMPRHGRDLRPLEVHVRWVRTARFPGAGARERVVTIPQIPGLGKIAGAQVAAGNVSILVDPAAVEFLDSLSFRINVRVSGRVVSAPYGYELDVRQGGQTRTRLRVAGRCRFYAGLVTCRTRRLSLS
jgi:hypothetical protein